MEVFIIVDNQTGFSYNNVDLGFAVFELPNPTPYSPEPVGLIAYLPEQVQTKYEFNDKFFAQPNIMNKISFILKSFNINLLFRTGILFSLTFT